MGLSNLVSAIYLSLIGSDNIRQVVFPDLAAGITLTGGKSYAYGAWAQIVATVGTADVWLTGGELAEGLAAGDQYQYQLGTGAGGAETGLAAQVWDSRNGGGGHFRLGHPVHVLSGTRLAARVANAAAGAANTIIIKVHASNTVGS